jgi:hypothetical protein
MTTLSTKTYWTGMLYYIAGLILLPIPLNYFIPSSSLSPVNTSVTLLLVSFVFEVQSLERCYSSSKLKKMIMVWISSSTILIASSMTGFFLFYLVSKNHEYSLITLLLELIAVGLFLMIACLLIIWFRKKKINK